MSRVRIWVGGLLALVICWQLTAVRADQGVAPAPAPTNAEAEASKRIQVIGEARVLADDAESARQAATLNAYRQLIGAAQELWGFGVDLRPKAGQNKIFIIDQLHPNDRLLGWILRAREVEFTTEKGIAKVTLASPPVGEISSAYPHLLVTQKHDVDGDGLMETVGAGYDGRIYVLKETSSGLATLGATESYASYFCEMRMDGKGALWEQVRVGRIDSIVDVESAGPGLARVVANLSTVEEVDGRFLGRAEERREIVVNLDSVASGPTIEMQEPFDFSGVSESSQELAGELVAPSTLARARMLVNGRPLWRSPQGLESKSLRLAMTAQLESGWNRIEIEGTDRDRRRARREILVRQSGPVQQLGDTPRRAILVATDKDRDLSKLGKQLVTQGGFPGENVTVLHGVQADTEGLTRAFKSFGPPQGPELIFIYFAGRTVPGALVGGKTLKPYGDKSTEIEARQLTRWLGKVGERRVLAVFETSPPQGGRSNWLDEHLFLETFEQAGWMALSLDDPRREVRQTFFETMMATLDGEGDLDSDGFVEPGELYPFVSRSMGDRSPGGPLLRGRLMGRIPLTQVLKN